jgi:hypothetical protein
VDSKLLRQERVVVIACVVLLAVSMPLDALLFPEGAGESQTPVSIVAGLLLMLGHMMWISMDRTRRGRQVGGWRFLAFFLAPLAIVLYLLLEYRARGVLYVLLYAGLLGGSVLIGFAAAFAILRAQGVA